MPPRKPTPPPSSTELDTASATVTEVEEALRAGRAPRSAKQLRAAARALEAAGETASAVRAYQVLAQLEVQRGNADQAMAPARAALRLARTEEAPELIARSLMALARLRSEAGEHTAALRAANEAVQCAWESRDPGLFTEALRGAAIATWEAGNLPYALSRLDEALEKTSDTACRKELERLRAVLFLQAGCPTAAQRELSRLLKENGEPAHQVPTLIARGWTWASLGKPDTGARDFRKARRLARELADRGAELEATAALAAADAQRLDSGSTRAIQAAALAERVQRQAARHRDARLARTLRLLRERDSAIPRVAEAADRLVQLAQKTEDLDLVDACVTEVERLDGQPRTAPAYGCPVPVPIVLE